MSTENTPIGKKRQSQNQPVSRTHSQPMSVVPLLVEDGIYCAEHIVAALAISEATLDRMIDGGLRVGQRYTKRRFFRGRDVMEFLLSDES